VPAVPGGKILLSDAMSFTSFSRFLIVYLEKKCTK
jgi:hypothetical protein